MVRLLVFVSLLWILGGAPPAFAQQQQQAPPTRTDLLKDLLASTQGRLEIVSATHYRLAERVDLPVPGQAGSRMFADLVEFFFDTNLLVASGNVAFTNPEGRITAERIEFNIADGTATFHDAVGIISLGPQADRAAFGNQDPDVYFWGDRIEKLGAQKYRITRGGFTACVQPTPRWEVTSKSIVLNLDDYALARGTILRVKGVPLLYLPALYYPLHEDQRSTGFLMPTYGTSTLRGGALSNAFFWAIGRSHDATFFHDWFTRTGQGAGAEYRYVANVASSGEFRAYRFNQRQSEYTSDGVVTTLPAKSSYDVLGSAVHAIGQSIHVRGRAEYASDLITQQLYQQNVYRASNPRRLIEGGVSGAWGAFTANALYQRSEVFRSTRQSSVTGSTPRLNGAIAPTRLFGMPAYASVNSEYAYLPYRDIVDGKIDKDRSQARFDVLPTLRVPFSRLTFLTVNSNATYRFTYYDRSLDTSGNTIREPIGRTYFAARSDIVGPVFNKIWDTPGSETIDRMKHVIEPTFRIDYVAQIENAKRLPSPTENADVVIGGTTSVTYGITNRLFYRQRPTGTSRASSQEFLTIGVQQTYYSNPAASQFDFQYSGSANRSELVDLSPIAVTGRYSPTTGIAATGRLEYDVNGLALQTVSVGGSVRNGPATSDVTFSRVIYSPTSRNSSLTMSNMMRFLQGRATGGYSLSWDLARGYVVSQTLSAAYMAQCCGFQMDYQQYNFPDVVGFPISADRRLNFGFVLAGLGTFSNFFGAFGGQP